MAMKRNLKRASFIRLTEDTYMHRTHALIAVWTWVVGPWKAGRRSSILLVILGIADQREDETCVLWIPAK